MKKILARLFPLALLMIVIGACGSQNPDLAPTPAPPDVDAVRASETPVPPVAATTPRITRQVGTATPLMPTLNSRSDDRRRHAPCGRCNSNPATCALFFVSFVASTTVRLSVYERPGRP
ncbi:MAG TPA: hypothetical protein EYM27_12220 [Dehalococcoidia bacterium]|nr:hypothetical protein [Dehalococcoidia bacterium]